MSRQECSDCGVQTPEFGCKNCGSTKLYTVTASPADLDPNRMLLATTLLDASHASRARSDMLAA